MAVFGRRELHINGVVVADEQPVTGRLEGLVVAEPGRVEDGRREQDDEHGDTRAARPDVATSVQRVTDGDVATESHVHSQPRTAQLERVDQTLRQHHAYIVQLASHHHSTLHRSCPSVTV